MHKNNFFNSFQWHFKIHTIIQRERYIWISRNLHPKPRNWIPRKILPPQGNLPSLNLNFFFQHTFVVLLSSLTHIICRFCKLKYKLIYIYIYKATLNFLLKAFMKMNSDVYSKCTCVTAGIWHYMDVVTTSKRLKWHRSNVFLTSRAIYNTLPKLERRSDTQRWLSKLYGGE